MSLDSSIVNALEQGYKAHKHVYLVPTKQENKTTYTVEEKSAEFISEYAFNRLQELKQAPSDEAKKLNSTTTKIIYATYKKEYAQLHWIQKVIHSILALVGMRHSAEAIELIYQQIQDQTQAPVLGEKHKSSSPENAKTQLEAYRNPVTANYKNKALTKNFYEQSVKTKLDANAATLATLNKDVKAIRITKLKEEAYKDIYKKELPKLINEGYYNPAMMSLDIEDELGAVTPLKNPILSANELDHLLKEEINKYQQLGKLNKHQAGHLEENALDLAKDYLEAYPEKNYRDAFYLVRDLIRIATYQEIKDKASFNGSDHGTKHIHHNIQNSHGLHKNMKFGKDYNVKDRFLGNLVQIVHDTGYTVPLANTDFDCCKDHPFIGAKFIQENKDYFVSYLDKASYKTLHRCVLNHAIVNTDLTAREEIEGHHPGMVRAISSISDACAITYDRKTQEFWEQPRALVALARLKNFLVLFPEYKGKLGDDIVKGPWDGYDENNPWDKMAYDIFKNTVAELNGMVDQYNIPEEKKKLFRQAIKQQFNAFKTNITLGQYGAVLAHVGAVPNDKEGNDERPDYLPEFTLAPSIMYDVIKDLFGADQANESFKKLVAEFDGDMAKFEECLNKVTTPNSENKTLSARVQTGNAIYHLLSHFEHNKKDKAMAQLQGNLKTAIADIHNVFKNQKINMQTRTAFIKALDEWYKKPNEKQFGTVVQEHLLPLIPLNKNLSLKAQYGILEKYFYKWKVSENEFREIKNAVRILLISEEEYLFMRGSKPAASRAEMFMAHKTLNP